MEVAAPLRCQLQIWEQGGTILSWVGKGTTGVSWLLGAVFSGSGCAVTGSFQAQ